MTTTVALAYLVGQSAKNRFLSRLRRAKNPRYALAMIIGAAYIWMIYLRPQMRSRPPGSLTTEPATAMWMILGTAVLLVLAGLAWFIESGPSSLALDDAESYFILPAPVSRRGLVGYKVMRAQLAVVMTVIIWSVLLRRSNQSIDWPLRAIGIWIFFTTTNLHRTGAEIVRAAWAVRGSGAMRKHWGATLAIIAVIVGLAASLGLNYNDILAATRVGGRETLAAIAHALDSGPAGVVLWPIHAILAPMLASSNLAWAMAAPAAVAVLAAHAIWVATADDQAIDAAVVRASDKVAMIRRTKVDKSTRVGAEIRPRPDVVLKTMPLSPIGWPGGAIIWKNILCMRRKVRPTTLLTLMLLPAGMGAIMALTGPGILLGLVTGALGTVGIMVIAGPLLLRSDLRTDMINIVALKLMPLRGRTIVAAEVLSVVVPLGLVQAGILVVCALASLFLSERQLSTAETLTILAGVVPALIVFNAAYVTIQNTAPVLFPAWAKLGVVSGGMEAIGQMVIVAAITAGLMALMLLVPGAVAAGIIFAGRSQLAPSVATGLIVGGALLAAEVAAVIAFLGGALERTEPSDVGAP